MLHAKDHNWGFSKLLYGNYLNSGNFCSTNCGYSLQFIVTKLILNKRYLEADPYSLFLVNFNNNIG